MHTALPGFSLSNLRPGIDSCWYRGLAKDGTAVLVRRIDGIPFADAIRDLTVAVESLGTAPEGVAPSLAVLVTSGGNVIAGSVAASAGFSVVPAAAAAVPVDGRVDVWTVYADVGEEVLADAATDAATAAGRLADVARVLDRLSDPHGSIDAVALRFTQAGPLVLANGLASLEAARRDRLDAVEPWLTVSPERCLPPGLPGRGDDQYALAVLWLTSRTGRPPHKGPTADALVRSKLTEPPTIDGLIGAERDVVARALALPAEERFGSCAEFAQAVVAALTVETPVAETPVAEAPVAETPDTSESAASHQATTAFPPSISRDESITTQLPPNQQSRSEAKEVFAGRLANGPYKTGDQILPGYWLVRLLGKGGFGEVWKATAPGGMSVAIKVIGNLGRKEGARELRALGTVKDLKHVHIVPIFGVWLKTSDGRLLGKSEADRAGEMILRQDGTHQFGEGSSGSIDSLELVVAMGLGDRSLYDVLKGRGPEAAPMIEPAQLIEWMRQAARAIDSFNRGSVREGETSEAVQHCDIKPQNILLVGNAVQVCDFGLARAQGQARATANNLLSIAYAAPEMMVRPFNPSPSTDQYCLAVTYYELRTGRLPYGGQGETREEELSVAELMKAKIDGKANPLLVPATEQRVLQRALSLDPSNRFGSCEELIDMLEAAIDADATSAPAATPPFPWLKAFSLATGAIASVAMACFLLLPTQTRIKRAPDYCLQARSTFAEALDRDGAVDLDKIGRAMELARKAAESGGEACGGLLEAADAVAQAAPLIAAITNDTTDLEGLKRAEVAVARLPEEVPVSVAEALRRALAEQVAGVRRDQWAAVRTMLDAAVADDGDLDAERLSQAEQQAEKLGRFDEAEAKRFASLAIAIREIAGVVGDADHTSANLDAAIGRLDRTAADLPPRCADVLGRGLARRLVDRGMRRLRDSELLDPESPTAGKVRAIEDSCQDLSASLRIDPLSWAALSELGFCKSLRGDYDQAIDRYGEALALLDKAGGEAGIRDEILRRRAYSRVKTGRYSEAADDYLACMKGNKALGTTLLQLADDGVRAGAFAEAAAVLDRTRRLLDENPAIFGNNPPAMAEVLESLVWLMVCGYGDDPAGRSVPLARKQLALADAAAASSNDDDKRSATATVARGNALDNLALAYARAGDWDEAIRTIDEAIAHVEKMPRMQAEFRKHREAIAGKKTWNEPN